MKRKAFLKISALGSASIMTPLSHLYSSPSQQSKNLGASSSIDISVDGQMAVVDNARLRKVIRFSDSEPASIRVASLVNKGENKELLADNQTSWFECIINNQFIRSVNPLWKFQGHTICNLNNGGKELELIFSGSAEGVKGLAIHIIQQVFPSSALIREKVTLRNPTNKKYQLNKRNNIPHFVFPRYRLKTDAGAELTSTEFRMATWGKEILDKIDNSSYDSRKWDDAGDLNLAMNHMFHSVKKTHEITSASGKNMKGPLSISSFLNGNDHFLLAYEHASQDNLIDFDKEKTNGETPPLSFLGIYHQKSNEGLSLSVNALQGSYVEGTPVDEDHPYQSVWNASGFYHGKGLAPGKKMIRDYLLYWINDDVASREPLFYYNTWAMQREEANQNTTPADVVKTDRILDEIEYAGQLGVDVFVLDAGWEQYYGRWRPIETALRMG